MFAVIHKTQQCTFAATLSNLNRFQYFLQCQNRNNVRNRACIYLFIT